MEVGVLQVDRRCPIAGTKKGRRIPNGVHPEVGSVEKRLVEPLQVDEPPTAVLIWDNKNTQHQAARRLGDAANGMLGEKR